MLSNLETEIPIWADVFHSREDVMTTRTSRFIVENFLMAGSICGIGAPIGHRKSLIALNIVHSLCTGMPLFDFLSVLQKPKRVLYICPEMGLSQIKTRIVNIGLMDYVGRSFFVRSMNLGDLDLLTLPKEALDGSVLILDTAIRFTIGDENSSAEAKKFSNVLFELSTRVGADGAIIVLYHSNKDMTSIFDVTLENCFRGSGEYAAALTDAYGTIVLGTKKDWTSKSFIRHVKPRDYEGVGDFTLVPVGKTGRLVKEDALKSDILYSKTGRKADGDGKQTEALEYIKANLGLEVEELKRGLKELGISRGVVWIGQKRKALRTEAKTSEPAPV